MLEPYVRFFFSTSFYCTNTYNAYFDSTYGYYYHQQTCDDTWTTTTASLTCQNVATTSTCQNASMTTTRTTTRTCNDDKRVPQPPLAEHTMAINGARDADTSRASTFFVCLFFNLLSYCNNTNGYFLDCAYSTSNDRAIDTY